MQYVDMVVLNGKTVRIDGKQHTAGQTFRATPKQARLWSRLGRAQIDPAGACAPRVEDLPKPTATDLRDAMRQQREFPERAPEQQQQPERDDKQDTESSVETPAAQAPRRRNYKRRDMTAQPVN